MLVISCKRRFKSHRIDKELKSYAEFFLKVGQHHDVTGQRQEKLAVSGSGFVKKYRGDRMGYYKQNTPSIY